MEINLLYVLQAKAQHLLQKKKKKIVSLKLSLFLLFS